MILDIVTFMALLDVAWNDNIIKLEKISYDNTIDVQLGVYKTGFYKGWLTVNLKPSHGEADWKINLKGWWRNTPYGKAHAGYWKELEKYGDDLLGKINKYYQQEKCLGILIAGRSKGAAEAELLIPMLPSVPIYCGAFEPPRCCDKEYQRSIKSGTVAGVTTCYRNDIVPGVPPWFIHPFEVYQNGRRGAGLSWKDHRIATEEKEVWIGVKR